MEYVDKGMYTEGNILYKYAQNVVVLITIDNNY